MDQNLSRRTSDESLNFRVALSKQSANLLKQYEDSFVMRLFARKPFTPNMDFIEPTFHALVPFAQELANVVVRKV